MLADATHTDITGTAVAMMLVPQSLAYASIAGLQPIYGLYTSWVPRCPLKISLRDALTSLSSL